MMAEIRYRQDERIAEAERSRLLAAARRHRRRSRADGESSLAARGQPDGTLTACDPHVAVPAR